MNKRSSRTFALLAAATLLITSCSVGIESRPIVAPGMPALDVAATQPTPVEKVVSLATLTSVPTWDPNMATPTPVAGVSYPPSDSPGPTPAPTHTPLAKLDVLEGTGIEMGMIADPYAGIQLGFPAGWSVTPFDEAAKADAKEYTTWIESPPESYSGGGPVHLTLTVAKDDLPYEKAIETRLKFFDKNDWRVLSTEEWTLDSGEPAMIWFLDASREPSAELLTVLDGRTIILSASGDLFLFRPIAAELQRLTASK